MNTNTRKRKSEFTHKTPIKKHRKTVTATQTTPGPTSQDTCPPNAPRKRPRPSVFEHETKRRKVGTSDRAKRPRVRTKRRAIPIPTIDLVSDSGSDSGSDSEYNGYSSVVYGYVRHIKKDNKVVGSMAAAPTFPFDGLCIERPTSNSIRMTVQKVDLDTGKFQGVTGTFDDTKHYHLSLDDYVVVNRFDLQVLANMDIDGLSLKVVTRLISECNVPQFLNIAKKDRDIWNLMPDVAARSRLAMDFISMADNERSFLGDDLAKEAFDLGLRVKCTHTDYTTFGPFWLDSLNTMVANSKERRSTAAEAIREHLKAVAGIHTYTDGIPKNTSCIDLIVNFTCI